MFGALFKLVRACHFALRWSLTLAVTQSIISSKLPTVTMMNRILPFSTKARALMILPAQEAYHTSNSKPLSTWNTLIWPKSTFCSLHSRFSPQILLVLHFPTDSVATQPRRLMPPREQTSSKRLQQRFSFLFKYCRCLGNDQNATANGWWECTRYCDGGMHMSLYQRLE